MSRLDRPEQKSQNPSAKFLSWKSNDKCLSFYDKQASANIEVKLPFKFAFLEHYHTVKGWNDKSESGIYSNEVFLISQQELTVKAFKGGEIASGLYSDIRSKVRDNGGVYHRSIYVVTPEGELVNLSFKGAVVSAYSDFCKLESNKFEQKWIEINSVLDLKKGATKYSVPVFTMGEDFTPKEDAMIVEQAKILQAYMNDYVKQVEPVVSAVTEYNDDAETKDELDF